MVYRRRRKVGTTKRRKLFVGKGLLENILYKNPKKRKQRRRRKGGAKKE